MYFMCVVLWVVPEWLARWTSCREVSRKHYLNCLFLPWFRTCHLDIPPDLPNQEPREQTEDGLYSAGVSLSYTLAYSLSRMTSNPSRKEANTSLRHRRSERNECWDTCLLPREGISGCAYRKIILDQFSSLLYRSPSVSCQHSQVLELLFKKNFLLRSKK